MVNNLCWRSEWLLMEPEMSSSPRVRRGGERDQSTRSAGAWAILCEVELSRGVVVVAASVIGITAVVGAVGADGPVADLDAPPAQFAAAPRPRAVTATPIEIGTPRAAASGQRSFVPIDTSGSSGTAVARRFGGERNGGLSAAALQRSASGCVLAVPAALAYDALTVAASEAGHTLQHSGCYRTFAQQIATRERWCAAGACRFAAVPGTSMHGWGLAVDFRIGDRALSYGDELYAWLMNTAPQFGFYHPEWARPGGSVPEPWHWEFALDGAAWELHRAQRARAVPEQSVVGPDARIPA